MAPDGTQDTCVLALLQRMRWATLLQRLGEKSTPAPKTVCAPCRNEGLDIIARDKNALKRMQTQLLQIIQKKSSSKNYRVSARSLIRVGYGRPPRSATARAWPLSESRAPEIIQIGITWAGSEIRRASRCLWTTSGSSFTATGNWQPAGNRQRQALKGHQIQGIRSLGSNGARPPNLQASRKDLSGTRSAQPPQTRPWPSSAADKNRIPVRPGCTSTPSARSTVSATQDCEEGLPDQ